MERHFRKASILPLEVVTVLGQSSLDVLTRKEIECLEWCKEGKTNWEIGEILFISET